MEPYEAPFDVGCGDWKKLEPNLLSILKQYKPLREWVYIGNFDSILKYLQRNRVMELIVNRNPLLHNVRRKVTWTHNIFHSSTVFHK